MYVLGSGNDFILFDRGKETGISDIPYLNAGQAETLSGSFSQRILNLSQEKPASLAERVKLIEKHQNLEKLVSAILKKIPFPCDRARTTCQDVLGEIRSKEETILKEAPGDEGTSLALINRINTEKISLASLLSQGTSLEELKKIAPYLTHVDVKGDPFNSWSHEELFSFIGSCSKLDTLSLNSNNITALPPLPDCTTLNCPDCRALQALPRLPSCTTLDCAWHLKLKLVLDYSIAMKELFKDPELLRAWLTEISQHGNSPETIQKIREVLVLANLSPDGLKVLMDFIEKQGGSFRIEASVTPDIPLSDLASLQGKLSPQTTFQTKKELLMAADRERLLDIPSKFPGEIPENERQFIEVQRGRSLEGLLAEYEDTVAVCQIISNPRTPILLKSIRSIIWEKIDLLSVEEKKKLKDRIAKFETTAAAQFPGALLAHRLGIVDRQLIERQREKSLEGLLDDYENFTIGRGLPGNLASKDLSILLKAMRSIVWKKIHSLSGEEKVTYKDRIAKFKIAASTAQFSGALQFAHRLGIAGEGVPILVKEEMDSTPKGTLIGKTAKVKGDSHKVSRSEGHGFHVTGIVQQMAPDAPIAVISRGGRIPANTKVINASFGTPSLGAGNTDQTSKNLKTILESGKLVIKASGNDGSPLDLPRLDPSRYADQNFLTDLPADQKGRMILTGNLEAGNVPAPSSNWPGNNPSLQDHFLWTLGSDVLSLTGIDRVGEMTGTSMSAPVVTGAAALVQSLCPTFTPEQVKECLLESADRDFWVHKPGLSIHIVRPDRPVTMGFKTREGGPIEVNCPFDKNVWGKGVLNVRRALEYAYLRREYNLSSDAIREILDFKEQQAATKIQNLIRSRARKAPPS